MLLTAKKLSSLWGEPGSALTAVTKYKLQLGQPHGKKFLIPVLRPDSHQHFSATPASHFLPCKRKVRITGCNNTHQQALRKGSHQLPTAALSPLALAPSAESSVLSYPSLVWGLQVQNGAAGVFNIHALMPG